MLLIVAILLWLIKSRVCSLFDRNIVKLFHGASEFKVYRLNTQHTSPKSPSPDKTLKSPTLPLTLPIALLIPGLGNGKESFNWNLSTQEQREKTGLQLTNSSSSSLSSLQHQIADLGYITYTFDPPGYGDNVDIKMPDTIDEYCELIHNVVGDADIIIGHSIGARIAYRYSELYPKDNMKIILLDPTPDYVLHTSPEIMEKKKGTMVGDFMRMIINSPEISSQKWEHSFNSLNNNLNNNLNNLTYIIYSIDDNDPNNGKKQEYFSKLISTSNNDLSGDLTILKLKNATHWVHISNPDRVLDIIK